MTSTRMARLGDAEAPFRFKRGDRVAWVRFDGSPDPEFVGVVVDAVCEYQPRTGAYKAVYLVRRNDGSMFGADHISLLRLSLAENRWQPGTPYASG